jgi:hypothetical protein
MMCEKCEQPMVLWSQFLFDAEPGDTPRVLEQLKQFKALGIELGAKVTVYRCLPCDTATAVFEYPK